MEKLLQLQNISAYYGTRPVLKDVSIAIDEGEVVALMGPNGAGKSTVIKTIFGLTSITAGSVLWHEQKIEPKSHLMVQLGISYVGQGKRVFPTMSVKENIEIGGFVLRDTQLVAHRLAELFSLFPEIKAKQHEAAGNLSGGQQQMVALARGLMTDPKVLLLDEPSLGLAPKIVKDVFGKIKEINERRKTAILIVEHNITSLLEIADRAYVLANGCVMIDDTAHNVVNGSTLHDIFMGKYKKSI